MVVGSGLRGPGKGLGYAARQGLQPLPRQLFCGAANSLFALAGDKVSRDLRVVWLPAWKHMYAGNDRFGRRPSTRERLGARSGQCWTRLFLCTTTRAARVRAESSCFCSF